MPMTTYYTLAGPDYAKVGATSEQGDTTWSESMYVGDNPRHLPVVEITGDWLDHTDITDWRLVTVTPVGGVLGRDEDGSYVADAWTVATVENIKLLLGPQADLLLAADKEGDAKLNSFGGPGTPDQIFCDAINALYEPDTEDRRREVEQALGRALGGSAALWLGNDVYGLPLAALAARDLIGTVDGWDQAAYDLVTGPWVAALGPIHPDDTPTVQQSGGAS